MKVELLVRAGDSRELFSLGTQEVDLPQSTVQGTRDTLVQILLAAADAYEAIPDEELDEIVAEMAEPGDADG